VLLGKDSEINDAVSRLENLIENEIATTGAETLSRVENTYQAVSGIKRETFTIRNVVERLETTQTSKHSFLWLDSV